MTLSVFPLAYSFYWTGTKQIVMSLGSEHDATNIRRWARAQRPQLSIDISCPQYAEQQRRNVTIRGPRHFLRSGPLPSDLK